MSVEGDINLNTGVHRPAEGIRSLAARDTDNCELPGMDSGNQICPCHKSSMCFDH